MENYWEKLMSAYCVKMSEMRRKDAGMWVGKWNKPFCGGLGTGLNRFKPELGTGLNRFKPELGGWKTGHLNY